MSITPYANTAPSGVDWIGSIPTHWHIQALSQQFREHFSPNNGGGEGNVLSLSYGRIVDRDVTSNDGLLPESFDTYQIVEPGDIVLRPTDMQNDQRSLRTGIVRRRGIITSAYICLRAREVAFSAFGHLVLHAVDLTKVLYSLGGGLRQSLKFADLRRLPLPIPPAAEQVVIAAFIERETGKIDALVAEQERLIALLKEKRQALISHAVTKGLDPNVRMKDSGVEWLGRVPAHWDVTRLKYATDLIVDCPHETPTYDDDGEFFVVRTADVDEGRLAVDQMRRVAEPEYRQRVRRSTLQRDDVVYGREGERWGHAALIPTSERYCLGQRMMQFRACMQTSAEFLMWQLNSECTYRQGDVDTVGATSPHVNVSTIRNFAIAKPPIDEQRAIANFIGRASSRIDGLVDQARSAMELLHERRSTLISSAVTGKIDVRGLAA